MAKSREIRNVAIVGTGVIGASWAALYLARGLNVVATDPAPNAEANLRKFVDAAWKDLTVIGLSPNASRDHLQFTTDMSFISARLKVCEPKKQWKSAKRLPKRSG